MFVFSRRSIFVVASVAAAVLSLSLSRLKTAEIRTAPEQLG
jgi:hypothetical protein